MTARVLPRWLPLLLAVGGCFSDESKPRLVSADASGPVTVPPPTQVAHAPATEEVARRVSQVGHKVLAANPHIGLHPVFTTIGAPQPEIFHRETREVLVSEGLVRRCRGDDQVAAVLCRELGKMVAEREAKASPGARLPDRGPPLEVRVGNDLGGAFGSADGTGLAERAQADRERHPRNVPPPPPPPPEVLARSYLRNAGYPATTLEDVLSLLGEADAHSTFEKQMTSRAPLSMTR